MITLDTSAVFAALARGDRNHRRAIGQITQERGPFLCPAATLGEIAYLAERSLPGRALDAFLTDLQSGSYTLDCGEDDSSRVRALLRRYAGMPLGFVDAAVIACAERNGGRVLTFDLRHFGVVAREGTITLVP